MNHDTHQYALPKSAIHGERYSYSDLDPYAVVDDHTTEITAIVPPGTDGPWSEEIMLAAVRLRSRVRLCERNPDDLKRLHQFIGAMVEGRANPLGNLRQYQDIQYDINDAVGLFTSCGGVDEFFANAHARHDNPDWEWIGGVS